jgi:hypothetical protein
VIKSTESCQRFVFVTGVTKFSKVSVFSKLNNLTDLTMEAKSATLLGYTQTELEENFSGYIDQVCSEQNIVRPDLLDNLQKWYNGYRFEESAPTVYNPVSVGKFFESGGKFRNYWFETGTPTFLIELIRTRDFDLSGLDDLVAVADDFSTYEIGNIEILPLLFQTGYLTITEMRERYGTACFRLDFPNREVRDAFNRRILQSFSKVEGQVVTGHLLRLLDALEGNDLDRFFAALAVFFANVPYDIQLKHERYFQTIFHVIFTLIGVSIGSEVRTEKGRIDAVAVTDRFIHLFEFKIDGSADDALAQIRERDYFRKYASDPREKVLVGVNFSTATRNIGEWKTTSP